MGFGIYTIEQYNQAMGLKRQGLGSLRVSKILGLKSRNAVESWINKGRKPYYFSEARIKACNSKENIERMRKMNAITQPKATKIAAELKTKKLLESSKILTEDLAYILGVVYGDGHVSVKQRKVILSVTDYDFADIFRKTLAKWSGFRVRFYSREPNPLNSSLGKKLQWVVYIDSKEASKFLADFDLNELKNSDIKFKSSFLKGFYDSEGCVTNNGELYSYNKNYDLLKLIECLLNSLDINTTFHSHKSYFPDRVTESIVYNIYIRADSRQRFKNLIGFNIERKQSRLIHSCSLKKEKQKLQEAHKMSETFNKDPESFEAGGREKLGDHVVFIGNKPFMKSE